MNPAKAIITVTIGIILSIGIILFFKDIPKNFSERKISIDDKYASIKNEDILSYQLYEEKNISYTINRNFSWNSGFGNNKRYTESSIKKDPNVKNAINNFNEEVKSFIDRVNKNNSQINVFQISSAHCSAHITKRETFFGSTFADIKAETKIGLKYNIFNKDLCDKINQIEYFVITLKDKRLNEIQFLDRDSKELFVLK